MHIFSGSHRKMCFNKIKGGNRETWDPEKRGYNIKQNHRKMILKTAKIGIGARGQMAKKKKKYCPGCCGSVD